MPVSYTGLDLSFMKENPLPKDWGGRKQARPDFSVHGSDLPKPYFMDDIKPFVNVANSERAQIISSRSELRSFERSFNCHQVGNDFPAGTVAAKNEAKLAEREKRAAGVESGWA
jgi:hypothetical protein